MLVGRWLLCSSLFVASAAQAQPYATAEFAAPYVAIEGTTLSFIDPDDASTLVPIGFDFVYYGRVYTHVNVATNGYLWFAEPCQPGGVCALGSCVPEAVCADVFASAQPPGPQTQPLPSARQPTGVVAPFWDDLHLRTTGRVLTRQQGTAPNRVLIVEWSRVPHGSGGNVSEYVSFEVELHEDGTIAMAWGPTNFTATPYRDWIGNIAFEDPTGSAAFFPSLPCASGDPFATACRPPDLVALTNHRFELRPIHGAELTVSLTAPPLGSAGGTIDARVVVQNIGVLATTSPSTVDLYLSADRQLLPGNDSYLGTFNFGTLAPGETFTTSVSLSLAPDLATGTYYVGAIVDPGDLVLETSDDNNTAVSGPLRVGPDITGSVTSPQLSGPGELVALSVNVRSLAAPVASVSYAIYLSADGVLDLGDQRLTSGTSQLGGRSDLNFPVSFTLSSSVAPGTYRLAIHFDPQDQLTEIEESNNIYVSPIPLAVRPSDLVASPPEAGTLFLGLENQITGEVRNGGGATASDFNAQFYLAGTPAITLSELGPLTLASGEARTLSATVLLDPAIPPGSYRLGFVVDSTTVVAEERETNNVAVRDRPVIVRWPAPDFRVVDLSAATSAAVGERLAVSRTLGNDGNLAGAGTYRLYLSSDAVIEPGADRPLLSGSFSLASHQDGSGVDVAQLPADLLPGSYWLGYAVDPDAQVDELDDANNLSAPWALEIEPSGLSVLTSTLPEGTVGLPYRVDLSALGGVGSYRWSVSPSLPPGLSLDPGSGRIEGVPERAGQLALTVEVSDGHLSASRVLRLSLRASTVPLEIITRALPPAFVGRPLTAALVAVGGTPPYAWSSDEPLPEGLMLSAEGAISGTAVTSTSVLIHFAVADSFGLSARRPLVLSVVPLGDAVRFSGAALPDAVLGRPYGARFEAVGGLPPYLFELTEGTLPAGLSLEGGEINGTPSVVGTSVFRAQVVDARGDRDSDTFVLIVGLGGGVQFATTSLPPGVQGRPYVGPSDRPVRLEASSSGGGAIHYSVASGALPPGISLDQGGLLAGTPSLSGVFSFVAMAEDDAGQSEVRALAIAVDLPPPTLPPAPNSQCGCATTPTSTGPASLGLGLVVGLYFSVRGRRRRRATSC